MDSREGQTFSGPYRATKLWNEIVNRFRSEIPLSRHRRHMRFYDNCFVACDAVSWLNEYLNRDPNFAFNVTRHQTIQLLGKFLKSRVFEEVRSGGSSSCATRTTPSNSFKDNRDLYRFPRKSPVKVSVGRSPLRTRVNANGVATVDAKLGPADKEVRPVETSDHLPKLLPCQLMVTTRQATVGEVEAAWKEALLSRLGQLLDEDVLSGLRVNPKCIVHNSTRIGRSGIVDSFDRSKELPHWILSAMKCLVAWPKASGLESCLPNYPGFERDVFGVVLDYFRNLEEPLTTFVLYDVLVSIYVFAEELDAGVRTASGVGRVTRFEAGPMADLVERLSRASVIDLEPGTQNNTSTPLANGLGQSCPNLLQLEPTSLVAHCDSEVALPRVCFETVFLTENPVTRIVAAPNDAFLAKSFEASRPRPRTPFSAASLAAGPNAKTKSPRSRSVDSLNVAHGRGYDVDVRQVAMMNVDPLARRPIEQSRTETGEESNVLNVLLNDSGGYLNLAYNETVESSYHGEPHLRNSGGYVNLACTDCLRCPYIGNAEVGRPLSNVSEESESYRSTYSRPIEDPESDYFAASSLSLCRSVSSSSPILCHKFGTGKVPGFSETDCQSVGSEILALNSPDKCLRSRSSSRSEGLHSDDSKSFATEAMQLCLLLLEPDVRRNLHRLLRFMAKVVDNEHLKLDLGQSNRFLVLNTFSRSLLRPKYEADYDEQVAVRTVCFLLDNCDAILSRHVSLIASVELTLASIKKTKIRYSGTDCDADVVDCTALTYCKQVTAKEYEQQKGSMSETAIADLLDNIVIDPNISAQERRKRLKQFKKVYPEIYGRKFPNETQKKKQTAIFKKPLQKLLEMRL